MKKTSRKVVKAKPARQRTDHSAGCRVNDAELAQVRADIAETVKGAGIPISLGAYTKHAILEHFRLRKLENLVKDIIAREDRKTFDEKLVTEPDQIIEALRGGVGS